MALWPASRGPLLSGEAFVRYGMKRRYGWCLVVLFCLTGCAKNVQNDVTEDYVSLKLREAAELISADLALFTGSSGRNDLPVDTGPGLSRSMDLLYDGPLETALSQVAAHAGFQFSVMGHAPKTPVCIHLQMKNRPCLAILREIGRQTGKDEMLVVSEKDRSITLSYEKNVPHGNEKIAGRF